MNLFLMMGIGGMVLILIAFLLNQAGKWRNDSLVYDLCNLVGSVLLTIYAVSGSAWPFVVLNGVWAIYSLKDVIGDLRR